VLDTQRQFPYTSSHKKGVLINESNHIVELDHQGKKELDFSLAINSEAITAITRVDALGKIIYTTPDDAAVIGREIFRLEYFMK